MGGLPLKLNLGPDTFWLFLVISKDHFMPNIVWQNDSILGGPTQMQQFGNRIVLLNSICNHYYHVGQIKSFWANLCAHRSKYYEFSFRREIWLQPKIEENCHISNLLYIYVYIINLLVLSWTFLCICFAQLMW